MADLEFNTADVIEKVDGLKRALVRLAAYEKAAAEVRTHFDAWQSILERAATQSVSTAAEPEDAAADVLWALHELTAMRRDLGALLAIDATAGME